MVTSMTTSSPAVEHRHLMVKHDPRGHGQRGGGVESMDVVGEVLVDERVLRT